MKKNATALTVWGLLCAICLGHALYYYPGLPQVVATHFDAAGTPDGWSSRQSFLAVYLAAVALAGLGLPAIALMTAKLPDSMISIPNKAYWLAPGRRREALALMVQHMLWFSSATLALLLDFCNQIIQVQLGRTEALDHPIVSILLYLAFSFTWIIALVLRFSKVQDA